MTIRAARRAALAGAALLCLAIAAAAPAAPPSYGDWSAPVNLGPTINTAAGEAGPGISDDGLSLYFHSLRPGFGMEDIYVSHRTSLDAPWGAPVNLGPTINSASGEQVPAFSPDGHWLFFSSNRPGGFGGNDNYASWRPDPHDDLGWQAPVNLGPNVNTSATDYGPSYFENEGGRPQLFFSSTRPGGPGGGDIYLSELQPDGSWGPATPIVELSSAVNDTRPTIRRDGLEIFFHRAVAPVSGAQTDLWYSTRPSLDAPWSPPVAFGPDVNTTANEGTAYVSSDARTLLFLSARTGGFGSGDVWMMTRAAKLTVTADDQARLFGQANPILTYEMSGFVGGETASVVSGSASCSTTATPASPAGEYPITCTVGSLSAAGYLFESFVAGMLTVSYTRPCLTEPSAGPLGVATGEAVCVGAGGSHVGPVAVAAGGSLDVEGGTITGPVRATGAAVVRICGATIVGPLTITGSTGQVLVGGKGCEPNTIMGPVRITDTTGGVEFSGNRVIGPLRITGNTGALPPPHVGPVHADDNAVTGPVTVQP